MTFAWMMFVVIAILAMSIVVKFVHAALSVSVDVMIVS